MRKKKGPADSLLVICVVLLKVMSHTKICNFTATKFTEKDVVRLKVAVGNMVKVKNIEI